MEVKTRTIPERLMPDANHQFVINHPFGLVFYLDKPLPRDRELISLVTMSSVNLRNGFYTIHGTSLWHVN